MQKKKDLFETIFFSIICNFMKRREYIYIRFSANPLSTNWFKLEAYDKSEFNKFLGDVKPTFFYCINQLSGQLLAAYGYGAPEFDSGVYTWQSDVYSFGVVMLELLTGRMSYDRYCTFTFLFLSGKMCIHSYESLIYRDRSRAEQFLVRWAVPQLHDIDALGKMVDPSLNGQYPAKSLSHFADIISRCVQVKKAHVELL